MNTISRSPVCTAGNVPDKVSLIFSIALRPPPACENSSSQLGVNPAPRGRNCPLTTLSTDDSESIAMLIHIYLRGPPLALLPSVVTHDTLLSSKLLIKPSLPVETIKMKGLFRLLALTSVAYLVGPAASLPNGPRVGERGLTSDSGSGLEPRQAYCQAVGLAVSALRLINATPFCYSLLGISTSTAVTTTTRTTGFLTRVTETSTTTVTTTVGTRYAPSILHMTRIE